MLRLNNIAAGPRPVTLPMIFGVRNMSCVVCTTINTIAASSSVSHTGCPVCADCTRHSRIHGGIPNACIYGTRLSTPIISPIAMPIGIPIMAKPMAKSTPTHSATNA